MESAERKFNVFAFVVGSLIGLGAALLLAPQSGKRTRRHIVRLGGDAAHRLNGMQTDLRRSVDKVVSGCCGRQPHIH